MTTHDDKVDHLTWLRQRERADALKAKLAALDAETEQVEDEADHFRARAEQAERDLADALTLAEERLCATRQAERERDEARAEVSEWHALSEAVGFAHEPDTGPVVVDAAAREAFAEWTVRARRAESDAFELTVERDALKAKLAESTEWGSRACEVLGYVLGTLNLCDDQHWAFDPLNVEPIKGKAVAVRLLVRDLRAKLAKTERERDEALVKLANGDAHRLKQAESLERMHGVIATERAAREKAEREQEDMRARLRCEAPECNVADVSELSTFCTLHEDELTRRAIERAEKAEAAVVEAARSELTAAIKSAEGIDHAGPGSASFSRIFREDAYPTTEAEADAFVKARMRLWLHTWVTAPMRRALDALAKTSAGSAPNGVTPKPVPEPAGTTAAEEWTTNDDLNADACEGIAGATPATLSDLSALEERIVERVARAASVSDRQRYANDVNTHPMSRLADELRRKP